MEYKLLPTDEYGRLAAFNARNGLPAPDPLRSIVAVIESQGEIIARWDLHYQLHLDNGCIDKPYRGRFLNLRRLFRVLKSEQTKGTRIYSTPTACRGEGILQIIGFKPNEFPLYKFQE